LNPEPGTHWASTFLLRSASCPAGVTYVPWFTILTALSMVSRGSAHTAQDLSTLLTGPEKGSQLAKYLLRRQAPQAERGRGRPTAGGGPASTAHYAPNTLWSTMVELEETEQRQVICVPDTGIPASHTETTTFPLHYSGRNVILRRLILIPLMGRIRY
jgi:hypothetical protein